MEPKNIGSLRGRPLAVKSPTVKLDSESRAMSEWGFEATRLIKEGMLRRKWGFSELADALRSQGIWRSSTVINRRINRQNFSAGFFLACLFVLAENEGSQPEQTDGDPTSS